MHNHQEFLTFQTPKSLREWADQKRKQGKTIALVPTMGALHAGHLKLVSYAKERCDHVVVSVFVNPTQFGPHEDYDKYPRDLSGDASKVKGVGCSAMFAPDVLSMYSANNSTKVSVSGLTDHLCGPLRPGHFEGVTTIVAKLFLILGECSAVFGRKDYQQLKVIKRMASDLFFPVHVLEHPIVRESDGLAMSSRNGYLSSAERKQALAISRGLSFARHLYAGGERGQVNLLDAVKKYVGPSAQKIDYIELVDSETLSRLSPLSSPHVSANALPLLAVACFVGRTRLIDNTVLGEADDGLDKLALD